MPDPRRARQVRRARFGLTDNSPASTNSTEQAERVIVSGNLAAPKRRWAWRDVWRGLGLAVLAGGLFWVLFLSGWLNVHRVTLGGAQTVSQTQVADTVSDYFKKIPLQRNILFTDTAELSDSLKQTYPTFSKVNIYRTVFLTLQVQVVETTPALIWRTGSEQWLIGTDGRILRRANDKDKIQGSVTDTAQLSVESGKKVADAGFVEFVLGAYRAAKDQKLTITQVTINDTTREANLILDDNIQIRTDTTRSAQAQVEAAAQTLQLAQQQHKTISEYIDTRVTGRTYYK